MPQILRPDSDLAQKISEKSLLQLNGPNLTGLCNIVYDALYEK